MQNHWKLSMVFHSLSPRLYSVNNQKHEITAKPPNYKISKSSLFTTPFSIRLLSNGSKKINELITNYVALC